MDHKDRAASVALVYIVDAETIDLEPTLLKGPPLKVRPPLSDHIFRRPRTLTMSASGSPGLKRYRSVVTPKETIIFHRAMLGDQVSTMDWGMKNRLSRIIKPSTGHAVMLA